MLEKSDTDLGDTLAAFSQHDLDVALIVPTDTGLKKSIMDATSAVRNYLAEKGVHDFDGQAQGQDAKVTVPAFFIEPDSATETSASLYRPETKNGDPRIWFSLLGRYAEPYNLLAITEDEGKLYVINCSRAEVMRSIHDPASPLGILAAKKKPGEGDAALELLGMLRDVCGRGFIQTLRPGSTGIGMTLETVLGIAANSSRAPDYKGIELKAKRTSKKAPTRSTLFSRVPDWKLSPVGSAKALIERRGQVVDGRPQLYHEMNALAPNSYGLYLALDAEKDWLKQVHADPVSNAVTHDTTWQMPKLRRALADKHAETFWVTAKTRGSGETEAFHYVQVEHTRSPRYRNFDALIEGGVISLDYLMHLKPGGRVRDHGYLFKIHPKNLGALFPPSTIHALAS